MADNDTSIDFKKDTQGKNIEIIYCAYCPSKILNPGAATFVNIDVSTTIESDNICDIFIELSE